MEDRELYVLWRTDYSELSASQAALTLAGRFGFSYDSVRGRLSRGNTPETQAEVLHLLSTRVLDTDPSVQSQLDLITHSKRRWESFCGRDVSKVAVFLSDLHMPEHRVDAYALTLQILADIQPDLITASNDALDNAGYGRWGDSRRAVEKVWSEDVTYRHAAEREYYRQLRETLAPFGVLAQVAGNHDNWYYNYLRSNTPATAELQVAMEMQHLNNLSVLQFSRGYTENYLELGKGLVFWHGQYASKLPTTNARNTLRQFMVEGVARSVVVGHTHRPAVINGEAVGYNGVTFVNNGCLRKIRNVSWLKRDPIDWGLSITVARYEPTSRYHEVDLINYVERGNKLVARYNGQKYETKLTPEASS